MKKNMVRIVALLLVAMLALTLIPMGALAVDVCVDYDIHDDVNPSWDYSDYIATPENDYVIKPGNASVTIKASDYPSHYEFYDELYDLQGILDWSKEPSDPSDWDETIKTTSSIKFDTEYIGKYGNSAWLIYTPHQHKLSYWYSDGTTHWRECLVCKNYSQFDEDFMYQNWCTDGDEDGICNVCGGDVPYHDVTVIESEGGKITVNKETASHRTKITADVEPAEGYKLKKLHFTKVRDDGSEQEITRYKKNGQFWTYMPTYDLEVSAEFVKTK